MFRRVAYEGSASVVLCFKVLLRCMMGMRWMDTRQLVAYNHMFINFNRVVLYSCADASGLVFVM